MVIAEAAVAAVGRLIDRHVLSIGDVHVPQLAVEQIFLLGVPSEMSALEISLSCRVHWRVRSLADVDFVHVRAGVLVQGPVVLVHEDFLARGRLGAVLVSEVEVVPPKLYLCLRDRPNELLDNDNRITCQGRSSVRCFSKHVLCDGL